MLFYYLKQTDPNIRSISHITCILPTMLFSDVKETSGLVNRGRKYFETKFNIFVINKFLDTQSATNIQYTAFENKF